MDYEDRLLEAKMRAFETTTIPKLGGEPKAPLWAMVVGAVIVLGWPLLVSWIGR